VVLLVATCTCIHKLRRKRSKADDPSHFPEMLSEPTSPTSPMAFLQATHQPSAPRMPF